MNNTYYKLTQDKELNVAYLGGSVTYGTGLTTEGLSVETHSWRALTTEWLKEQYPDANITSKAAAIGGTGSIYGAHRVLADLNLKEVKPDLVFIEQAINDALDASYNSTPAAYMESIINTIYEEAPNADIVIVLTSDYWRRDTMYAQKLAHIEVAEAYDIPYIDVGAPLWQHIVAEAEEKGVAAPNYDSTLEKEQKVEDTNIWWKYFDDSVHPRSAGYAKYAEYIQEALATMLETRMFTPGALVPAYKPENTLTDMPVAPYIDNLLGETAPQGISILEKANGTYSVSAGAFAFTEVGAKVTVKFYGTDLKLWIKNCGSGTGMSGTLKVTVDGADQSVEFKATNHKVMDIASNLKADTEHTVTLELTDAGTHENGVSNIYIRNFMISGDEQQRGVTLVSEN